MSGAAATLWDCHVHVIGPREHWPLSPHRSYEPPQAPLAALIAHLDALGAAFAVAVQPSVYGFDNSCLLAALAQAEGRLRGVAVPAPGTPTEALARMHEAGVRGVRCNLVNAGGLSPADVGRWVGWMAEHGWHLQVQVDATVVDVAAMVRNLQVPIVVDHMGYPPRGTTATHLAGLAAALESGRAFVKLSAPYRISTEPRPHRDVQALAAFFLSVASAQCLWGSDWPHTECSGAVLPATCWRDIVRDLAGADWPHLGRAAEVLYGTSAS